MARSILIVEDDIDLCNSLNEWLQTCGYQVVLSHEGTDAVRKVKFQHFDLVICDIGLPRLSGDEVIDAVKKVSVNKNVPVVIISGNLDKDVLEKVRGKVVRAFVKPFEAESLVDFVKKLFQTNS